MKTLLLICLSVLCFPLLSFGQTPYRVRDLDPSSERFAKVIAYVKLQRLASVKLRKFEVLSSLGNGEHIVNEFELESLGNAPAAGAAAPNYRKYGNIYHAKLLRAYADGEIVEARVDETEQTVSYTTTGGSKRTIRKIEELAVDFTTEQLIEELKGGKTYRHTTKKMTKCSECLGFGRVSDTGSKIKSPDGKMPCPDCKGSAEVEVVTGDFLIQW